jgi:LmbE family N-acetylglucosaminyl deacetylase
MNPFLDYVRQLEAGLSKAQGLSVQGRQRPTKSESKVLLFSPHPDDECITGLLPLRLMRETGRQVINVPVTFGSNEERQVARALELENACAYLGFRNFRPADELQPLEVKDIVSVLVRFQPDVIFVPHADDWNSRHVSTNFLVMEALDEMDPDFSCLVVETEFWRAMSEPNLMVEGDATYLADLVAATSLHAGEVARNPYHLLLPAWMQDNVRRGSELIGGQGHEAPAFGFATLYCLRKWQGGKFLPALEGGALLPLDADLNETLSLPDPTPTNESAGAG